MGPDGPGLSVMASPLPLGNSLEPDLLNGTQAQGVTDRLEGVHLSKATPWCGWCRQGPLMAKTYTWHRSMDCRFLWSRDVKG